MLVSYISLMYIMLNFQEFLDALVQLGTASTDDLVDGVSKIFVTMSFLIYVTTTLLESLKHLHKSHFTKQPAKQISQSTSLPVEELNASTADALVVNFDISEFKLDLENQFNHQMELELELELEHSRRRDLERELELELNRKINFDGTTTVTADSSESVISDADFLAEQQRTIQEALGDPSAQITWGEFKCEPEPTREQLELTRLEQEFIKVKRELIEHQHKLERTLTLTLKLSNSKCQQPVRSVAYNAA